MRKKTRLSQISRSQERLGSLSVEELIPLPPPYDRFDSQPSLKELSEGQDAKYEAGLDGVSALLLPKLTTKEEEEDLVKKFLAGLEKLLSRENNWTFLQPLMLSLENCAKCQTCSDACPIYTASGKQEIYRPIFRSEVFRRIVNKYLKKQGKIASFLSGSDIELNWTTLARLAELAYRCTLCRRCAQACPIGVDNAVIAREIRKLFSQEMGIAPRELHELGTVKQLKVGSSTGMTPKALGNIVAFMEDEIEEKTGRRIEIPVDKEEANILLMHNAGEFMAWPENTEAFAILFDAAGIDWTLSSEIAGYDAVNYGVWYDDVQAARVAVSHAEAAKQLKVKKICVGECGHSHKAMLVIADRILTGDLNIPRESAIPLMEDIVCKERIKLDPSRNDFPVTLHDPCNLVRLSGIVEPQRRILRQICPQFREMEPHGVDNYCCGGGSGFAIMQSMNFPDWRNAVAGRMKLKQILEAFADAPGPARKKYVCAPCSNCKGQLRDLFEYYGATEKSGIFYGGLVELIVNAMPDLKEPFIKWE
jgi:Fe-S oxidoreductase